MNASCLPPSSIVSEPAFLLLVAIVEEPIRQHIAKPKRSIVPTAQQTMDAPQTSASAATVAWNVDMKLKERLNQELPPLPTIQPIAESPPSSSIAGMPSMFNSAQNIDITGGLFNVTSVTNLNTVNGPSLEVLHKRVAPNAILNAGGRADEVRCHPGTREEVIDLIEEWGDTPDSLARPIFWLSGPAGAGKSAIVQTMAERCSRRKMPHANFFFFRADTSRGTASPLIATLLHQIILVYPFLQDCVAAVLSADPFIFDSTLANQLAQLIVAPLRSIRQSSSDYYPLLLLIDGLDECDSENKRSQQQVLDAFDEVLADHPCPFRLLVASRDESQIRAAFNKLYSPYLHVYLGDQYSPERDICIFVNAQFEQIRNTHPLAHTLDASWPTVEDVAYIVEKSSGQFIYAATVMRFILDSSASPAVSLERVQGVARLATISPFSHLDSIYFYILSQADDQEALNDILHAQLLITRSETRSQQKRGGEEADNADHTPEEPAVCLGYRRSVHTPLMELLTLVNPRYTKAMIDSCLADLTPIARHDAFTDTLLFYHASFSDYLLDQSRSRDYFVDTAMFAYEILPAVWNHMGKETRAYTEDANIRLWLHFCLAGLRQLQKLPPGLLNIAALSSVLYSHYLPLEEISIFQTIYHLCTSDDDVITFRRIVRNSINIAGSEIPQDKLSEIPFAYYIVYIQKDDVVASISAPNATDNS
ncbi:hypothetical protein D9619_011141 [Psilocybe cf. subviscida]|uniref:NACHT domain-containing protein n=1 Tax=Psilocybe cf. subviscida TaxID=2480587 RepID=A0A8H5F574_9AGAR|nr:hypothetical protein D9619_011141 [Psilocybe cf. subviscida]